MVRLAGLFFLSFAVAALALACGDDDGGDVQNSSSEPEGKVAFVSFREVNQEIFVKEIPDGNEANLTNDPSEDFDPDISEDGSRVLFVSDRSGQVQIYAIDVDGNNLTELTDDPSGGQTPRWSRDGTQIAFSLGSSLAVMNADGSNIRVLMEAQPQETADPCRAGAFVGGWSPDDSEIVYYSSSVSREEGQVCKIAAGGGDPDVIVFEAGQYAIEPVFSPDGSRIVYRAIIDDQHDIWIVDLASGERTNLTDDADLDIEPDWSPDGQWIAFGSLRAGEPHFDLFVMRADGTDVRRITDDPAKDANPVWGP